MGRYLYVCIGTHNSELRQSDSDSLCLYTLVNFPRHFVCCLLYLSLTNSLFFCSATSAAHQKNNLNKLWLCPGVKNFISMKNICGLSVSSTYRVQKLIRLCCVLFCCIGWEVDVISTTYIVSLPHFLFKTTCRSWMHRWWGAVAGRLNLHAGPCANTFSLL